MRPQAPTSRHPGASPSTGPPAGTTRQGAPVPRAGPSSPAGASVGPPSRRCHQGQLWAVGAVGHCPPRGPWVLAAVGAGVAGAWSPVPGLRPLLWCRWYPGQGPRCGGSVSEVLGCCGGASRSGRCSGLGTPWCGWAPSRGAGRCRSCVARAVWGRGARALCSGGAEGPGTVWGAVLGCRVGPVSVRLCRYIRAGAEAAVARCCHGNQHGDVVGWVPGGQAGPVGSALPGGSWGLPGLPGPRTTPTLAAPHCPPAAARTRPWERGCAGLCGVGGLGRPLALRPPCPSPGGGGPMASPTAPLFAWRFSPVCTLPGARGLWQRGAGRLPVHAAVT